jgi:sugar phosphate isomerase/epimerase
VPTFGICTSPHQADAVRAAGWEYVEAQAQPLLQGLLPDAQWTGRAVAEACPLPIPACNVLVPGELKITGPHAGPARLSEYMGRVVRRAAIVGVRTLVLGSGVARQIPDGFDRSTAVEQIVRFARTSAELADPHGVTIVAEPLNRGECNVLNSVAEAMQVVRAVDHPCFRCLVDSYHFWLEDEPLEHLVEALPSIAHVHVADRDGRTAPGQSGTSDYLPFFRVLKRAGYAGRISVEAGQFIDAPGSYVDVLAYLRSAWQQA